MYKKLVVGLLSVLIVTELLNVGDRMGGALPHAIVLLAFLTALLVWGITTVRTNRDDWISGAGKQVVTRCELFLLGIITVGALALRLHNVSGASYTADETIHLSLARQVPQTILPELPTGVIYIRGFPFTYLSVVTTQLVGINELGIRLPSIIAGTALVIVTFWLGRSLFGFKAGIAAAAFTAVDPYLIAYSQLGRFYMLFYLLVTASILTFYKSFVTKEWNKVTFSAILTLSLLTHDLTALIGPVFFIWWLIIQGSIIKAFSEWKQSLYIAVPGIIFLLFYWMTSYLFLHSSPGERLNLASNPIFGFNLYNIIYYRELLLNPYPVGWALILSVGVLLLLYDGPDLEDRTKINLAYVGSFILTYVLVLGFLVQRGRLRFIIVTVPLLHVMFGSAFSYCHTTIAQRIADYWTDDPNTEPNPESGIKKATQEFLEDFAEGERTIQTVLSVDEKSETWTFEELGLDSGRFGELVSRGIVNRDGQAYHVSNRSAVRAALNGNEYEVDQERDNSIRGVKFPSISIFARQNAALLLILLLVSNLMIGSIVVSYDPSISEIPDEEESNLDMLRAHTEGQSYAFHAQTMHLPVFNYRDAAKYANEHAGPEDIVISTANFNPADPYVDVDYNTNVHISSYLGYRSDGVRYELYRGIPIVTDQEQIEEIYDSAEDVYVIADYRFERHADEEVVEYIKYNSEVIYESNVSSNSKETFLYGENSHIKVYRSHGDDKKHNSESVGVSDG